MQHPQRFSGQWFQVRDTSGNSQATVVVAVVDDVAATARELREMVQHPDRLDVIAGRHTKADLMTVRDRLMRDWMPDEEPTDGGTHITTLAVDEKGGRVVIGLNRLDQDFAASLLSEYGSEWVSVKNEPQNVVAT